MRSLPPGRSLPHAIGDQLAAWEGPRVETVIFGTDDAARIADALARWCEQHLGAEPRSCLFAFTSVGCTYGLELGDGRLVALKAHQPRWSAELLRAARIAQASPGPGSPARCRWRGPPRSVRRHRPHRW